MVGVFLGILINEILLLKLGYLMENNIYFNYEESI